MNFTRLGEFLARNDRRVITVQGVGIEVDQVDLLRNLACDIANAGTYQVFICTAQSLATVTVDVLHVPADASIDPVITGTVVCDQVVEFYDETVTIEAGAVGTQGRVALPEGPGRYRVVVMTDPVLRDQMSRREQQIVAESSADVLADRLRELDGREWYRLVFRWQEPNPPDDD